jgi:hypothetical protein
MGFAGIQVAKRKKRMPRRKLGFIKELRFILQMLGMGDTGYDTPTHEESH